MMNLIEVNGVSKNYGSTKALDDIHFTLEKGRIVGLLGPNGSGKTTLIKILTGLIKNYDGQVLIQNQSIGKQTKALVSYLPDIEYFPNWMTLNQVIHYFADFYADFDVAKAHVLVEKFGLDAKKRYKTLSKGMKEKFQLSLIFARNALIYILDEPIGGIDPVARQEVLDTILNNFNNDGLLLISTHLISDIETIFDEVIFLKKGKIILQDTAENIRLNQKMSINDAFKEAFK